MREGIQLKGFHADTLHLARLQDTSLGNWEHDVTLLEKQADYDEEASFLGGGAASTHEDKALYDNLYNAGVFGEGESTSASSSQQVMDDEAFFLGLDRAVSSRDAHLLKTLVAGKACQSSRRLMEVSDRLEDSAEFPGRQEVEVLLRERRAFIAVFENILSATREEELDPFLEKTAGGKQQRPPNDPAGMAIHVPTQLSYP